MIKQRKITIFILLLTLMLVLPFIKISKEPVLANSNIQVMKNASGVDMTYRNSSEKVYGLSEYDYPTQEYRAVWVSTFVSDIPSYSTEEKFKSDATYLLDDLVSLGMNAIVFHVRTHNNALYNSDLNPIATWWSKVDFDVFDPLTWFIDECHSRGLEFHAWMNPYRVSDGFVGEAYPENHPCRDSSLILTNSSGSKILDPGSTVVQDFIVDTCMEFLDRYDADAIHFDDYFYISGVRNDLSANTKRSHVDAFIQKLSNKMKQMNEEEGRAVQLGISPSGIYQNGGYSASPKYDENGSLINPVYSNTSGFAHYGDYLYSDTKKWIDNEWIDYITPQTYWGMEHNGANFYELSRWWSWCVKYKKVNLYLGMGIYMAAESSNSGKQWQKNPNEVQNQLLNGGMYDEVKGTCYYKYSYLNSTNSIIKRGVDLIKNDYYKKRIPGAVIQRYEDALPSVQITNINLNGNVLSWDKVDNVFGYMVYQVPKGETLNTKDINHVFEYTQNNSVTNVDTLQYDYYVSSVNRANVISTPVGYGIVELSKTELIVQAINNLPANITLEHLEQVNKIKAEYDSLNDEEKSEIHNYNLLQQAIDTLTILKQLQQEAINFINTIDKHINTDRILPVQTNMKWSYVDVKDSSKYNLLTGQRLIDYIATEIIELYLEVTDGTYTHKEKVEFDLSYLGSGLSGLYYRNDPSAMSEVHIGQYTGTTSFIGWSNATVTVGNQVLFVADKNYHELTSSTIPSSNWTSCAGVYTNKSQSNISMTIGDAFSTAAPTYGYFVIGANNTIITASQESPNETKVTLAPNETLVIIRYLDRLLTNTPFTNFDIIKVGTYACLNSHEFTAPEISDVENVITLISTLPSNITLNDEIFVNEIKSLYDALSTEEQAAVSNKDILLAAVSKIAELKQVIETLIQQAIDDITSYVDLNNYSAENQVLITNYINSFKSLVNTLTTEQEISHQLSITKFKIDELLTLSDELEVYIEETINKINNIVDMNLYSSENQVLINQYKTEAIEALNNCKTIIEIDTVYNDLSAKVFVLPSFEEGISEYRDNKYKSLFDYVTDKVYSNENQLLVENIIYEFSIDVEDITDITVIDELYNEAIASIDKIPTKEEELQTTKENAISEISALYDFNEYNETLKLELTNLLNKTIEYINDANSISKVNEFVETYKQEAHILIITNYAKEIQNSIRNEINFDLYSVNSQNTINFILESLTIDITYETTTEDILSRKTVVLEKLSEVKTLEEEIDDIKKTYKDKIQSAIDEIEVLPEDLANQLSTAKSNAYEIIDNATNDEEIVNAYIDFIKVIYHVNVILYAYNQAAAILETIDKSLYSNESLELIDNYLNNITSDITYETTIEDIDFRTQYSKLKIQNVPTYDVELAQLKQKTSDYLDMFITDNLYGEKLQNIQNLIQRKKEKLKNLTTIEAVNQLSEDATREYETIINAVDNNTVEESNNCACKKSSGLIIILSILLSTALLIIRKKH